MLYKMSLYTGKTYQPHRRDVGVSHESEDTKSFISQE